MSNINYLLKFLPDMLAVSLQPYKFEPKLIHSIINVQKKINQIILEERNKLLENKLNNLQYNNKYNKNALVVRGNYPLIPYSKIETEIINMNTTNI